MQTIDQQFLLRTLTNFVPFSQLQVKSSPPPRVPAVERIEAITNNVSPIQEPATRPTRREHGTHSPSSPPPAAGKYSLLQFAMHHFRNNNE